MSQEITFLGLLQTVDDQDLSTFMPMDTLFVRIQYSHCCDYIKRDVYMAIY